jgi:hypothetical protein
MLKLSLSHLAVAGIIGAPGVPGAAIGPSQPLPKKYPRRTLERGQRERLAKRVKLQSAFEQYAKRYRCIAVSGTAGARKTQRRKDARA